MNKFLLSLFLWNIGICVSSIAQEQGLIINEFSNGTSGTKEYIEFLVVGCPGTAVDIRGWIFDDNNGDFSGGAITGKGIASGHSRFSMDNQWANVPVGSIILVYDSGDKNTSITLPDDPSDSNIDSVYVLSHTSSTLIQTCNSTPYAANPIGDDTYSSCTTYGAGNWSNVGMRNAGDAAQTRKPDGSYFHGFGYGDNDGGPDNLYFPGSGTAMAYSFTASECNYRDITNYTAAAAPGGESPGVPNNESNYNYIRFLREGITAGTISPNQAICLGESIIPLTSSDELIRCYVNYQWQSSTTGLSGDFTDIDGAVFSTYNPPLTNSEIYYRRLVSNSCEIDTSNVIEIKIKEAAQANAGEDKKIIEGSSVELSGSGNGSFYWTSENGAISNNALPNPLVSPTSSNYFTLTVTTPMGCKATDSVLVSVICNSIFIPTLITPNEDGRNDTFNIGCTEGMGWNLEIYNRWGSLVYYSTNYQNDWRAEGLTNDVYYFSLKSDVVNHKYKGWIQVLN